MTSIVGAAVRASKFYKHVVKLVEELIFKCTAKFKLPGLFIVDAILRQSKLSSRDRDLYGPRFMRNIDAVFSALSQCLPEDKPMILRVLQLWREKCVYPEDLIKVLQDLVSNPDSPDLHAAGTLLLCICMLNSTESNFKITYRV